MKTAKFTKALTIALHPEVYERVKRITDIEQASMAEWVRHVLERALKNANPKEKNI
jgi:predicted CopG family antitoxin